MATDATLRQTIISNGWIVFKRSSNEFALIDEVRRLGQSLGKPGANRKGEEVEVLSPTSPMSAHTNSLSNKHGMGRFPLHTDGAHRLTPPRFIVLACVHPGARTAPTVLAPIGDFSLSKEEKCELESAPLTFRNGRQSFHSTILGQKRAFVRFDQDCMSYPDQRSRAAAHLFLERANAITLIEHWWQPGDVLVIDNYMVLHGRGVNDESASSDRKLLRASVE